MTAVLHTQLVCVVSGDYASKPASVVFAGSAEFALCFFLR
jgi:hypothetical protein